MHPLEDRRGGNQLEQSCWTRREVEVKPTKVVDGLVETGGQPETLSGARVNSSLQMAKQAAGARYGEGHGSKFAEQFVPGGQGQTLACGVD